MKKQIYQTKTTLFTFLIINFYILSIHAMDPAPKKPVLPRLSFDQTPPSNTETRSTKETKTKSLSPSPKESAKPSKLTTSDPSKSPSPSPSDSPRKSPGTNPSPRSLQKRVFRTSSKLTQKGSPQPELIQAVRSYDLEKIQLILKDPNKDSNQQDQHGNTALHHAIITQNLTCAQKENVVNHLLNDPRTNSLLTNNDDNTAPNLIPRYDKDMEIVRQVLFARLTLDEAVERTIAESLKKNDAKITTTNSIVEQIKEKIRTIQQSQKDNTSLPKHILLPEYATDTFIEKMFDYRSTFTFLLTKEIPFDHSSNNTPDYLEELNMRVHIKNLLTLIAFSGEEKKALYLWLENKDFLKKTSFVLLSADQLKIKELHSLEKTPLGKLIKAILNGNAYYYGYQIGDTHFKHNFTKGYPVLVTVQLPFIVIEK